MPVITLCPTTKGKTIKPLLQTAHLKGGTQLQSLGMCIPASVALFALLANSAAQTTTPVPLRDSQEKGPWQGVCRKESHWI